MLAWIVGILVILGGLGWSLLCLFAPMMASRSVDMWREAYKPALPGLLAVAIGVAIIVWR